MKLKHLFLTFSFVVGIFSVAFAQQQQTALNVATTNPSKPMNFAGNEQACFVTNITNSATDGSGIFIDDMQLQIPDGFDLVSLSVVKNETTLVSNSLSMQLNDTLKPAESYLLNYCIRVNCDAVPTNLSNQFSVFFSNNLQVHYTEHDTIKTFEKRTNDFKLEVPSLSLTVGVGNANTHNNVKNIVWQTPVTDTFTIRNTAGAGPISNLRVSMLLMQNVDAFSDVKFSVVGGQFRNAEVEGGKYYIDLSSSDFQQAGLGDTLNADDQLKVAVSFIPTKFYLQTQAKYLAQVKNGSDVCNEQTNASAICDYHCQEPNVTLSVTTEIIQQANYCGREFICDVTFTNTSENTLTNTLKNARIYFENYGYQIISVQDNGTELTASSFNTYPLHTTDIDGDGKPDLLPQESHTYRIRAILQNPRDNVSLVINLDGESIDGLNKNRYINISNNLTERQFTLLSPTDTKDGDSAIYRVDVSLNPQYYFQQNGFMDVDYVGLMYNDELVLTYPRSTSIIQSDSVTIVASCDIPQLFKLVVRTNNCDIIYTKDSVIGKSVVECPDTLLNSSCVSVHTTEVTSISPQEINTCETFTINAVGELAYLSNDTCSRPQRIIARVYDLEGRLQFESVSCSVSVGGSSYTLQPSNTNAVNNGIAWISDVVSVPFNETLNVLQLQLNAEVFVKGDHTLPEKNGYNVRVEFAVEDNEDIIHNANSKGYPLTVYDPELNPSEPPFPASSVEGELMISFSMTRAAETASQHPIRLTHVDLPAINGYYYTTASDVGQPYSVDISNEYALNTETVGRGARFSHEIKALCYTDMTSYNGTLHGTYTYSDYYASCIENETFTRDFAKVYTLRAPVIEMNSSVEQALTRLTTWNVFVRNIGGANAPNVTLRIKPNENNVTNLNIENVAVGNVIIRNPQYKKIGDDAYVNIGTINVNNNDLVKVTITMSGCTGEGTSYLDVTAIWSCEDIMTMTNLPEEFELRNCNNFFTQLELENMEAVLVAESIYPNENEKFSLCQEIPIHLDVYNSGRAILTDVGFMLDEKFFSGNVNIKNDEVYARYSGVEQIIPNVSSTQFIGNISDTNTVISNQILKYNSGETGLPSRNNDLDVVAMDFSVMVNCGENDTTKISPLTFKISALGNCGESQEKQFIYHLPIEGLDQIQMVGITASSSQFVAMQSGGIAEGQLTVTVTNNSLDVLRNLIVNFELPDGLTIITTSNNSEIQGFALHSTLKEEGVIDVQLTAPTGYTIPIGESRTFTLTLQENEPCPKKSVALINAGILLDIPSNCSATGTCPIYAFTDNDTVQLERLRQPVVVTITGADTICVGNDVTLTASGASTYVWDDNTTNATVNVAYPKTTYHVTGYVGECSDTEEHTITFMERLTQPQLMLVVGADTITNGKIQYSDWNTLGEQIIHAESDINGTLTPISKPDDNKCGTYQYQYTIANQCDTLTASITFEVENCDTTTCENNDLVVIDGKTGYTLEDLDVLRGYIQGGATLQPTADGGFTITVHTNCGERTYTLNSCFLENADINKDGVVNNADIDRLAEMMLEQTNCQNNQNN